MLVLAFSAFGQTREVVAFVGSEYNATGSPKATLAVGALYPVSASAYAGVAVDLAFKKNQQPGITFRPEFLPRMFSFNGHDVFGIIGLGAQFQASDPAAVVTNLKAALSNVGTNVGYNAATGITTSFRLGKSNLYLSPVFRIVKGSLSDTAYVGGVVLATKIKVSQ